MPVSSEVAIFLAKYLVYFSVLVVPYLFLEREKHDLIRIAVSALFAFAVSELLKTLVSAPRPFVVGEFDPLISMRPNEFYASFPSGHAAFMAALGTAVFFTEKVPGALLLVFAALVGWGRVLVGVHYPVDVLAGAGIGILTSFAFKVLHRKFPVW